MFTQGMNLAIVISELDAIFFNTDWGGKIEYTRTDPYKVLTSWYDKETIAISARGFYKLIKAKNNIIDNLFGSSWESRVREVQQKAFEIAYITIREEEKRAYQLSKF